MWSWRATLACDRNGRSGTTCSFLTLRPGTAMQMEDFQLVEDLYCSAVESS